jgi:ABC-type sugar transport system ATPase subunit
VRRLTKKIQEAQDLLGLKERDPEAAEKLFPYDYEGELADSQKELGSAQAILATGEHDVFFGIRPEDIFFNRRAGLKAVTLDVVELLGADYDLHFKLGEKNAVAAIPVQEKLVSGDRGFISFDMQKAHLFDSLTEKTIF